MIEADRILKFWNYLTTEKNQIRPRGITVQRLAVVKPHVLEAADLWFDVIVRHGAEKAASPRAFYEAEGDAAQHSRANFWAQISRIIRQTNQIQSIPEKKNVRKEHNYRRRTAKFKTNR